MQVHFHLGYDTKIGKTLSVLITFALTYPDQRVLIIDMDNYGFKVHALLAPLADRHIVAKKRSDGRDYALYHVGGTQTYIASWPDPGLPNAYFDEMTRAVEEITNAIQVDLQEEDESAQFEGFQHVVVDTSESILTFNRIDRPLTLPKGASLLKFWINHDCVQYPRDTTPELFWEAHKRIRQFNAKQTTVGDDALSFIYIFNPAGFMTEGGTKTVNNRPILGFFGSVPYVDLINQNADETVWISPKSLVETPNTKEKIPTFDKELAMIMHNFNETRGHEVAKWWRKHFEKKPINVVFIPVEADLRSYREKWATQPLTSLHDFRIRLGDVLTPASVRYQWRKLISTK